MKKFIAVLMSILLCIGLVRYIAYYYSGRPINRREGQYPKLNLRENLKEATAEGSIFDFDTFYVDVQKIEWNFKSCTNAISAENGAYYETYEWQKAYGAGGAGPGATERIYNTKGELVGYFKVKNEQKPGEGGFLEWIAYIGNFVVYIGRILISVGGLLVDLFLEIIISIIKIMRIIVKLCFAFD